MANPKFLLFTNSTDGIAIHAEWDSRFREVKQEYMGRSKTGAMLKHRRGSHKEFMLPVRYVSSSHRSIIDSWWLSEADLFMKDGTTSEVFSVHIANTDRPITQTEKPYDNQFRGVIQLEGVFDQLSGGGGIPPSGFPDPWTDSFVWADDLNWVETL